MVKKNHERLEYFEMLNQEAINHSKLGGDVRRAQVFSNLAIAAAILEVAVAIQTIEVPNDRAE